MQAATANCELRTANCELPLPLPLPLHNAKTQRRKDAKRSERAASSCATGGLDCFGNS